MFKKVVVYFKGYETNGEELVTFLDKKHREEKEFKESKLGYFVSYHFLVDGKGEKFQTRARNEIGFHNKSYKMCKESFGILVNIEETEPTSKQYLKLCEVINSLSKAYGKIQIIFEKQEKDLFVNYPLIRKLIKPRNDLFLEAAKCKRKFFDNLEGVGFMNEGDVKALITIALNKK